MEDFLTWAFDLRDIIYDTSPSLQNLYTLVEEKLHSLEPADINNTNPTISTTSATTQQNFEEPFEDLVLDSTLSTKPDDNLKTIKKEDGKVEGRLGPEIVAMNKRSATGSFMYKEHDLELESHSNFSSIRANTCVFKGKWMYEVTLGTAGIQQIGWAPLECAFTNEEGVGDSEDSYAYDGKRVKKWSVSPLKYGQAWTPGDIIGCCIDLNEGTITFYRNGVSLGVAFTNVRCGANAVGLAYFPAISLSFGERCYLNFGGRPFEYPVSDYLPLQLTHYGSTNLIVKKSTYLMNCFSRLLPSLTNDPQPPLGVKSFPLLQEDKVVLSGLIFQHLGPYLEDEYVIVSLLYPLIMEQFKNQRDSYLFKITETLFICLEPFELNACLSGLFSYLGFKARTYSYLEAASSMINFLELRLVLLLLSHQEVMRQFLLLPSYSDYLESLITSKQPNPSDLEKLLPTVWWKDTDETVCSKEQMDLSYEKLVSIQNVYESLLHKLFYLFIENANPLLNSTPRQIFTSWVRSIVKKNKGATRNIAPAGLSDLTVLSNMYFMLLRTLQPFLQNITPETFPKHLFYDGQIDYYDFSRVGGTLSHLQKNMPIEHNLNNNQPIPVEIELVDDLIMLYHLGMSIRFKQASLQLQNQMTKISQLEDTNKRIKRSRDSNNEDGLERLRIAKGIILDDVIENVRLSSWYKMTLYGSWKQETMFSAVVSLVQLLEHLSKFDPLFSYIPELYIETLADSFHALRRGDPPFTLSEGTRVPGLINVIQFLIHHFDDKRIINPDTRDLLLQSISVLLQYQEFIKIFENPEVDRSQLIKSLLSAFDTRFWSPIATILLRFWKSTGFGQPPKKANEPSSETYQAIFREIAVTDQELVNGFLNKIFNNLNWALTEFGVAAKEFQQSITRHHSEIQQQQRKCAVMFDFSYNLLRMIEFVCLEAPQIFLDQEMNLIRLSESVVFVVNRTTTGPDSKIFESLLKLELLVPDRINRPAILGPVAGILVNLCNRGNHSFSLVKALTSIGGFTLETFNYLTNFEWQKNNEDNPALLQKIETLKHLIKELGEAYREQQEKQKEESSTLSHSPSAEFCPICYAAPIDTRFIPCGHQSCSKCIKRHLLNSNRCFFCNTEITSTVEDESVNKE